MGMPVLSAENVSDIQAEFLADPFMTKIQDTWHMFFEVMNERTQKGEIGWAASRDGLQWDYQRTVLTEPFHLSYPYVFQAGREYFMIPESYEVLSTGLKHIRIREVKRFGEHGPLVVPLQAVPAGGPSDLALLRSLIHNFKKHVPGVLDFCHERVGEKLCLNVAYIFRGKDRHPHGGPEIRQRRATKDPDRPGLRFSCAFFELFADRLYLHCVIFLVCAFVRSCCLVSSGGGQLRSRSLGHFIFLAITHWSTRAPGKGTPSLSTMAQYLFESSRTDRKS